MVVVREPWVEMLAAPVVTAPPRGLAPAGGDRIAVAAVPSRSSLAKRPEFRGLLLEMRAPTQACSIMRSPTDTVCRSLYRLFREDKRHCQWAENVLFFVPCADSRAGSPRRRTHGNVKGQYLQRLAGIA